MEKKKLLEKMPVSRSEEETHTERALDVLCQTARKLSKTKGVLPRGHRSQFEGVPKMGQSGHKNMVIMTERV